MLCLVEIIDVYATMYLLRVLFYDGIEHTQQFKYDRFFVYLS